MMDLSGRLLMISSNLNNANLTLLEKRIFYPVKVTERFMILNALKERRFRYISATADVNN